MIKILIADDHAVVRQGLIQIVSDTYFNDVRDEIPEYFRYSC